MNELRRYGNNGPRCGAGLVAAFLAIVMATMGAFGALAISNAHDPARITYLDEQRPWERQPGTRGAVTAAAAQATASSATE